MISGNPDKADPQSEMKIMTIAQPYKNHNGGNLVFGPDGYLYIGLGDGGSGGDPENRAQNPARIFGKDSQDRCGSWKSLYYSGKQSLLCFEAQFGMKYGPWGCEIPGGSALTGRPAICGLPMWDRMYWEEIDFQPAGSHGGQNYGWRCYEGDQPYNQDSCDLSDTFTFPVYHIFMEMNVQ